MANLQACHKRGGKKDRARRPERAQAKEPPKQSEHMLNLKKKNV